MIIDSNLKSVSTPYHKMVPAARLLILFLFCLLWPPFPESSAAFGSPLPFPSSTELSCEAAHHKDRVRLELPAPLYLLPDGRVSPNCLFVRIVGCRYENGLQIIMPTVEARRRPTIRIFVANSTFESRDALGAFAIGTSQNVAGAMRASQWYALDVSIVNSSVVSKSVFDSAVAVRISNVMLNRSRVSVHNTMITAESSISSAYAWIVSSSQVGEGSVWTVSNSTIMSAGYNSLAWTYLLSKIENSVITILNSSISSSSVEDSGQTDTYAFYHVQTPLTMASLIVTNSVIACSGPINAYAWRYEKSPMKDTIVLLHNSSVTVFGVGSGGTTTTKLTIAAYVWLVSQSPMVNTSFAAHRSNISAYSNARLDLEARAFVWFLTGTSVSEITISTSSCTISAVSDCSHGMMKTYIWYIASSVLNTSIIVTNSSSVYASGAGGSGSSTPVSEVYLWYFDGGRIENTTIVLDDSLVQSGGNSSFTNIWFLRKSSINISTFTMASCTIDARSGNGTAQEMYAKLWTVDDVFFFGSAIYWHASTYSINGVPATGRAICACPGLVEIFGRTPSSATRSDKEWIVSLLSSSSAGDQGDTKESRCLALTVSTTTSATSTLPLEDNTITVAVGTGTASFSSTALNASRTFQLPSSPQTLLPIAASVRRVDEVAGRVLSGIGPAVGVLAVVSVAGGQLGTLNAMVRLADCADASDDDADLPVLVHPLRFSLSPNSAKIIGQYAAAAVSNAVVIPAFLWLCVYWVLPAAFVCVRGAGAPSTVVRSMDSVRVMFGWPCVMLFPVATFAEGTAVSVVMAWRSGVDYVMICGFVGFLAVGIFVAWWARVLLVLIPRSSLQLAEVVEDTAEEKGVQPRIRGVLSIVRETLRCSLAPTHEWVVMNETPVSPTFVDQTHRQDREQRENHKQCSDGTSGKEAFLRRYGGLFNDKRWFYAELLSCACSIVVGVAEGLPTNVCELRAVVAMVAITVQCVCGCATLLRYERALQILVAACVVPMSVLVVLEVVTKGALGNGFATAVLMTVANILGLVHMVLQLGVGCASLSKSYRRRAWLGVRDEQNNAPIDLPSSVSMRASFSEMLLVDSFSRILVGQHTRESGREGEDIVTVDLSSLQESNHHQTLLLFTDENDPAAPLIHTFHSSLLGKERTSQRTTAAEEGITENSRLSQQQIAEILDRVEEFERQRGATTVEPSAAYVGYFI